MLDADYDDDLNDFYKCVVKFYELSDHMRMWCVSPFDVIKCAFLRLYIISRVQHKHLYI